MKRKGLIVGLVLLLCLLAVSAAVAEVISLDQTASVTLPDTFAKDQEKGSYTYYRDRTNSVILGYRVLDGQVVLKTVAKTLKNAGYTGVKTKTIQGVPMCYGSKTGSDGRKTVMYYFNTRAYHYAVLAFTYDPKVATARTTMDKVVNTVKVSAGLPEATELKLTAAAPGFTWTGVGGEKISSAVYGGKDMILIYGTATVNGYTEAFLDLIKGWIPRLRESGVQVLVGLCKADGGQYTDEEVKAFAAKYPGIVCGRYRQDNSSGLWQALENVGYTAARVSNPVVFLRNRANRLKYYSTGQYSHALTVVSLALQMAASDTPVVTPPPEETEQPFDETVTVDVFRLKISGKEATLVGITDPDVTELKIPTMLTANGVECKVTGIAAKACQGLKKLERVVISRYVVSIGKYAFRNCGKLSYITIGTDLLKESKIGAKAFDGIAAKPTILCHSSVMKNYKAWLLKKGVPSGASFRTITGTK